MYCVSSKFHLSKSQEVTCIFQVKTCENIVYIASFLAITSTERHGVQAEHFDAEHSHDKFESHGTKNAGALPDKVGPIFFGCGLEKALPPLPTSGGIWKTRVRDQMLPTWNPKYPIFLGNFTPKTSNYCLKNRALGFPGRYFFGLSWLPDPETCGVFVAVAHL